MSESTTDRIIRLIAERRDTIASIRATYDTTTNEWYEYRNESTTLANLSIAVKNYGFDGVGDADQATINELIAIEDENIGSWN